MTHYVTPAPRKKSDVSAGEGCALVVLILGVFAPLAMVYRAWVLVLLWGWFVVPVTGWPELSIWQAVGLAAVAVLFSSSRGERADELARKELDEGVGASIFKAVFTSIWTPTIALLIGYIAHSFS